MQNWIQVFWVVIDILLMNVTEDSLHQIKNCRRNVRLFQFFKFLILEASLHKTPVFATQ